jgi:hypothetical protein
MICIKGAKKGNIAKEHERQEFSKGVFCGYASPFALQLFYRK